MEKLSVKEEFAKKALKYLESAEAFTAEHVPAYVEEILQYKLIEEYIVLACSLIPLAAIGVLYWNSYIRKVKIWIKGRDGRPTGETTVGPANQCAYGRGDATMMFSVGSMICGTIFLVTFLGSLFDIIQINVAPRMFLVEYLQKLL